jgi:hypothetical protein
MGAGTSGEIESDRDKMPILPEPKIMTAARKFPDKD